MPSYFVDLVMNVVVEAESPEAAEALAPRLAAEKPAREGMACLVVQAAEEAQNDA